MADAIIRNGWIIDGTGNPRYKADVLIEGERIADVGRYPAAKAGIDIDATGKIVTPGFIDAHSHSDATIKLNPANESTIRQGITTEVVGNCGNSQAPMTREARKQGAGGFGSFSADEEDFTFAEYAASVQKNGNLGESRLARRP